MNSQRTRRNLTRANNSKVTDTSRSSVSFMLWQGLFVLLCIVAIAGITYAGCKYLSAKTGNFTLDSPTNGEIITNTPDGKNEAIDEAKITEELIAKYTVAPDEPRVIDIPAIGVRARVLKMGLNDDKTIQAPTNVNDTGWYDSSAKPGDITINKATFIDGHDLGPTSVGIFYKLDKLKVGDQIIIEKGDGTKLTYLVKHTEIIELDKIDMNRVLSPITPNKAGLNLMTCDGAIVNEGGRTTQTHRLVVYAELQ